MVAASDKQQSAIVICGRGRIGGTLAERLNQAGWEYTNARIDPLRGLYPVGDSLPHKIKLLVVCISARHRNSEKASWRWDEIFTGLVQQVNNNELQIEHLVMVSSTRVYEGYQAGLIEAQSPVKISSPQGAALAKAEQQLISSPIASLILRCSGLYGALYPVYTPIMLSGKDKPRFGVDAIAVVERLLKAVEDSNSGKFSAGIELMTDGNTYYEGNIYSSSSAAEFAKSESPVKALSEKFRILLNSKS